MSIQSFKGGGNASNRIQGPNTATVFNITGANAGNVAGASFSGFGNLSGGTANDTFVLSDGASLTGTINGGLGTNWIDYGAYTTNVIINLSNKKATNVGGSISSIQNARGGSGNDTLTGNSLGNILIGGSGRSILIGGTETDTINGVIQDDILIGGTTSFDGNFTALDSILAEWQSADSYATRVADIKNGGGLNGSNTLVSGTSVIDDSVVDSLLGNAGSDWFFTGTGDTTDQQSGEQIN